MRPIPSIVFFLVLISCNVKETIEEAKLTNEDLIKTFNHKDIDTSIGWGTDSEDNHVQVTSLTMTLTTKHTKSLKH